MFKSIFQTGIRAAYNVSDNPTIVSEPWSIYPAKHKQTGRVVSVFIFDKTRFENTIIKLGGARNSPKNPRVIISECYELLKFEFNQLSKLKHPQILTIYEVLEETKSKFIFVSEPVLDTLTTVDFSKNLDELSIQKGLLQVSKSIQFLHNYCSIIHFNLQPSSVFINSQGDWKLSGFKFLQNLNEISPQERDNFYIMDNQSVVPFANHNLNYMAPELIIDSTSKLDLGNDLWSLGCLIFYLYNGGENLINCFDSDSISDYRSEFSKFESKFYNHRTSDLKYLLKGIPENLYHIFPKLMARYPHDRMTIDQFIESDFFNGSLIKAMWFIDEFSTKALDEKLIFVQGLLEKDDAGVDLLSQLPIGFKTSKLLPLLMDLVTSELTVLTSDEVAPNLDSIISYSLHIVFTIGSSISSLTFQDRIYETLLKDNNKKKSNTLPNTFTKLLGASVKTRLALIENISILSVKLNDKQFLELIKKVIEFLSKEAPSTSQDQIKLQESFLSQLPGFVQKIEFPYIKNTLFPLICSIFKTTTVLSTKLITIDTFEMLISQKIIDKLIVNEQLFPILKNVKSRDKRIVRSVLQFFHKLSESEHISLEMEVVVENIIPQCYLLAFGCSDCTQQEFKQFMSIINGLQSVLMEKKLATLSNRAVTVETNDKSFASLIEKQKINEGNKDSLEKGPQSKILLKPRVSANVSPTSSTSPAAGSRNSGGAGNSGATRTHERPSSNARSPPNNSASHFKPLTLKPSTPKSLNAPTSSQSNSTFNKPLPQPLSFGATSATSASSATNNLLNSLKGTSFTPETSNNDDDDDDFEDFQQAESKPSLDWNVEVRKNQPMNLQPVQKQSNPIAKQAINLPTAVSPQATTSFPPGFNASMVLKPTGVKSNGGAIANSTNGDSRDPFDLL